VFPCDVRGTTAALAASTLLLVSAAPLRAQSATATDVPDRFVVEAGGYNMFVSTDLTLNSARLGGSTVSLENDLNLPGTVRRGYVEGFWRIARRHQVSLNYGRLNRDGGGISLGRAINWGGVVYQAGVTATGRMDTDVLSGAYRLAVYKNSRFEVGPSLGFGYLWLTAGITAITSVAGPQANTGSTLNQDAHENTPIGDVGGFANLWAATRVFVRSDLRYIIVNPSDSQASVTQGRASATWYPWRHLGFGGQYSYDKLRYDRSLLSSQLGGSYRYQGFQILASTAF
jgi:hypothetical protein